MHFIGKIIMFHSLSGLQVYHYYQVCVTGRNFFIISARYNQMCAGINPVFKFGEHGIYCPLVISFQINPR